MVWQPVRAQVLSDTHPYALPNKVAAYSDGQSAMWYLWRGKPVQAKVSLKVAGVKPGRYRVVVVGRAEGKSGAVHTGYRIGHRFTGGSTRA